MVIIEKDFNSKKPLVKIENISPMLMVNIWILIKLVKSK